MTGFSGLTDFNLGKVKVENVLPDMFPCRHVAERFDHICDRERFVRKRFVNVVVEHFLQIGEHLGNILRLVLKVLRQIDDEEADIVPERLQADFGIAVNIDFSDLHVTSKRLEDAEVFRNEIPCQ